MEAHLQDIARRCLEGAETGSISFPEIVAMLLQAGFDGYQVDYRRSVSGYFLPGGDCVEFPMRVGGDPVAAAFDVAAVQAAIREAQSGAPGYSYQGFSRKVKAAGCAGYLVSFPGRRVLYVGRTGETHTELFPQ